MKYAVTYCTMDREVGSNPLWHSFLLFSKMDADKKQLEVVDNWGFYGVPSTGEPDSWTNKLKANLGLDIDLYGNHGMLRHEEMRFLDRGCGLHGVTFELTKEKFEFLQNKCITMAEEQETAIKEVVDTQGIKGKQPHEKIRMYPHEQYSKIIYALEKIKAEQQGRESRLKPFEVQLKWGLTGPDTSQSFNCKTQVLDILATVLSPEQIERLADGGKHPSIPRLSGSMETIFLHSTGPMSEHKKASGEIVYYRNSNDPEVKLYWSLPPQELEALSEDTIKLLDVDEEYRREAKETIRKLQSLEWLLRNASVPYKYKHYQDDLIKRVVEFYKSFSIIETKSEAPTLSAVTGFFFSLFSLPKHEEQRLLQGKIKQAKMMFNSLYMAIVDGWDIDDSYPSETAVNLLDSERIDWDKTNVLEAIASYLSIADQKNLCEIIGRTYCMPEFSTDDEESSTESESELSLSKRVGSLAM